MAMSTHKARGAVAGLTVGAAITGIIAFVVEEAWGLDIGPIEGAVAVLINAAAVWFGAYYAPANREIPGKHPIVPGEAP